MQRRCYATLRGHGRRQKIVDARVWDEHTFGWRNPMAHLSYYVPLAAVTSNVVYNVLLQERQLQNVGQTAA